jgi:hypothetical protein
MPAFRNPVALFSVLLGVPAHEDVEARDAEGTKTNILMHKIPKASAAFARGARELRTLQEGTVSDKKMQTGLRGAPLIRTRPSLTQEASGGQYFGSVAWLISWLLHKPVSQSVSQSVLRCGLRVITAPTIDLDYHHAPCAPSRKRAYSI